MEEDTGKSLHVGGATGRIHGADYSLVDYNRAGIPLIEIVTKPVEGTGAARARGRARLRDRRLRELVRPLGVSDVRMEQGSLRCDANVSLRPSPDRSARARGPRRRTSTRCGRWSARCATRSAARPPCVDAGGRVVQETRHWHEDTGDHDTGPVQGAGGGLPLLPRARPRARSRRSAVMDRSGCARACRSRRRPCVGASCRRRGGCPTRDAVAGQCRRGGPRRATVAAGALAGRRAQVVAG